MSKIDVLLYLGLFAQNLGFIVAYFMLKSKIRAINARQDSITQSIIEIKNEQIKFEKLILEHGLDIKKFDEKGFSTLSNRVLEVANKNTEIEYQLRALDTALKTFYATWARKLGILSEKAKKAELEEQQSQEVQATYQAQTQEIQLPKRRRWGA